MPKSVKAAKQGPWYALSHFIGRLGHRGEHRSRLQPYCTVNTGCWSNHEGLLVAPSHLFLLPQRPRTTLVPLFILEEQSANLLCYQVASCLAIVTLFLCLWRCEFAASIKMLAERRFQRELPFSFWCFLSLEERCERSAWPPYREGAWHRVRHSRSGQVRESEDIHGKHVVDGSKVFELCQILRMHMRQSWSCL